MPRRETPVRRPKVKPIRQSVTVAAALALASREHLTATFRRFMDEQEPARKEEPGKDLIRSIFGKDAIAEDALL